MRILVSAGPAPGGRRGRGIVWESVWLEAFSRRVGEGDGSWAICDGECRGEGGRKRSAAVDFGVCILNGRGSDTACGRGGAAGVIVGARPSAVFLGSIPTRPSVSLGALDS